MILRAPKSDSEKPTPLSLKQINLKNNKYEARLPEAWSNKRIGDYAFTYDGRIVPNGHPEAINVR